ncbi:hypothetical protein C8Q76DRAFT_192150 [Earliella scabrosa]|nr:hypothetical protein C8Q76DRAFT_192150 [Earliella scabrosa]
MHGLVRRDISSLLASRGQSIVPVYDANPPPVPELPFSSSVLMPQSPDLTQSRPSVYPVQDIHPHSHPFTSQILGYVLFLLSRTQHRLRAPKSRHRTPDVGLSAHRTDLNARVASGRT